MRQFNVSDAKSFVHARIIFMQALHFCTKLEQTSPLGHPERTISEILTVMQSVPDSSIYDHTHRFLHQEQIPNNFLITRHIKDSLLFFLSLFEEGEVVYL